MYYNRACNVSANDANDDPNYDYVLKYFLLNYVIVFWPNYNKFVRKMQLNVQCLKNTANKPTRNVSMKYGIYITEGLRKQVMK